MEDNIPGYRIPGGQNPKIFWFHGTQGLASGVVGTRVPVSTVLCRGFTVLGPAPRRQYRDAGARLLTVVNDYENRHILDFLRGIAYNIMV